jgi:hypothetical protein
MDKAIMGIVMFFEAFQNGNFKNKIIDSILSIGTGMGVYFNMNLQISNNFYLQEIFKSFISILTASVILILSLIIRHLWNKKIK